MKIRILSLLLLLNMSIMPLLAMNPITDKYKTMLQSKLMTYASLLDFRYKCLCVKTSPEALLPVEIHTPEGDKSLEQVAKVGIMDDEHLGIFPNSPDLLEPICQEFLKRYPQLKQEVLDMDMSENVDPEIREQYEDMKRVYKELTGEDMPPVKFLQLTTPEVNDDMKDQLDNSVDAFEKMCKTKFQAENAQTKVEVSKALARNPQELDNANKELDVIYNNCWQQVQKYTMEEKQAIAEANCRYHAREKEKEKDQAANKTEDTYIIGGVTIVNSSDDQIIESATIEAGKGLYIPKDVFVERLTFKRRFTQNELSTFCVPFTFRASDVPGKFYVFGSYDADQNTVTFNPHIGLIEAGKGYFFMPDEDIEQLEFTDAMVIATPLPAVPEQEGLYGSLSKLIFLEDAYLMQLAADGTPTMVKADAEATLDPFQSYLWLGVEAEAPELILNLAGSSTAVATIDAESPQTVAPIYDLRGQRIAAPQRGVVYIQQGKKYINN